MINGKTIKLSYTAYLVNDWYDIMSFHFNCLKQSKLYDIVDEFHIFAYPFNKSLLNLIQSMQMFKITLHWNNENRFEYPALEELIQRPFDYNLYLHSKGTSKPITSSLKEFERSWNNYMSNYLITGYKTCFEYIDSFDVIGVEFKNQIFPHYHGNFWWSTKKHLENIKNTKHYSQFFRNRYFAEMIICSVDCRCLSLNNCDKGLYTSKCLKNTWKIEPKEYDIRHNKKCIYTFDHMTTFVQQNKIPDDTDIVMFSDENKDLIRKFIKSYPFPDDIIALEKHIQEEIIQMIPFFYLDQYDELCYVQNLEDIGNKRLIFKQKPSKHEMVLEYRKAAEIISKYSK